MTGCAHCKTEIAQEAADFSSLGDALCSRCFEQDELNSQFELARRQDGPSFFHSEDGSARAEAFLNAFLDLPRPVLVMLGGLPCLGILLLALLMFFWG